MVALHTLKNRVSHLAVFFSELQKVFVDFKLVVGGVFKSLRMKPEPHEDEAEDQIDTVYPFR